MDGVAGQPLRGHEDQDDARSWTAVSGKFVFLHVPKSAGTALRTVLCDAFIAQGLSPDRVCPVRDRSLGTLRPEELAAYDVFSGHFYFDQVQRIPNLQIVATLVREPRARLISLYNHLRATTWARIHELEAHGGDSPRLAKSLRFADYLRRKDFVVQINADNALTRHLIGTTYIDGHGNLTVSDDSALNIALANLQTLSVVGLVQESAGFLRRLSDILHVPLPPALPVRNSLMSIVTRNPRYEWVEPVAVDEDAEAEMLRSTRIDRQIYDHVVAQQARA